MTNPQHPAESTDYRKTIEIQGPPEALFEALTTTTGLSAWWAAATGSALTGGGITFFFPDPLVMHVDRADAAAVEWTVVSYDVLPEWPGTRPTFAIRPTDGGSEVQFCHHGLTADLECREMCSRGWDHFLDSLRQYVETGKGAPLGSATDQSRRTE